MCVVLVPLPQLIEYTIHQDISGCLVNRSARDGLISRYCSIGHNHNSSNVFIIFDSSMCYSHTPDFTILEIINHLHALSEVYYPRTKISLCPFLYPVCTYLIWIHYYSVDRRLKLSPLRSKRLTQVSLDCTRSSSTPPH